MVALSWTELEGHGLDSIPYVEGILPPRGYILCEDEEGSQFWILPESLKESPAGTSDLSGEQIDGIQEIYHATAEVYPITLEKTLENFSKDKNPEREIQVWEKIVRVYNEELAQRTGCELKERLLLFRVILQCSSTTSCDEILATLPEAKGLPNLARVDQLYRSQRD